MKLPSLPRFDFVSVVTVFGGWRSEIATKFPEDFGQLVGFLGVCSWFGFASFIASSQSVFIDGELQPMFTLPALGLFDIVVAILAGGGGSIAGYSLTHLSLARKGFSLIGGLRKRHKRRALTPEEELTMRTRRLPQRSGRPI